MKTLFCFIVLFSIGFSTFAQTDTPKSADLVIHLLDYLAKDYAGAVQNGKVISKSEYSEQVEFIDIVVKNAEGSEKLNSDNQFISEVKNLQNIIQSKGSAETVSKLARSLQAQAIQIAGINISPTARPDIGAGAKLFANNCVACHGSTGRGDGPAGVNLDPKPANFHDTELVWNSSPYKFFNTIRLGVPGTGMASYSHLSDKEVWDLAFYVKSLGHDKPEKKAETDFSLEDVSSLTDAELSKNLHKNEDDTKAIIASLRSEGFTSPLSSPLKIAEDFMRESVSAVKGNDLATAKHLALRAYLEGIEPLEPKMKANVPGLVEKIEGMMSSYRSSLDNKEPLASIEAKNTEILGILSEVKQLFSTSKMSPSVAFGAAFSIFLREGFEAILIIIILISILNAMKQPEGVKWVHLGWITALGIGVLTWFASGFLLAMSGMSRELMEGSISLLAVVVLLYVGFWLHRHSEMKKWRSFLEAKLKHGLSSGSYVALALVSFMAVFREAFEVVLFLRAIWVDLDPSGQSVASAGVMSSFGLLLVLSFFAIKESKRLPLEILFKVCSWTMMILAIVLVGKGFHSLQEAGFVPVQILPLSIRFDVVGIYPTYQTLIPQIALLSLFLFLFWQDKSKRTPSVEKS